MAHLAGLTAFQVAILLLFIDPRLAAVPLGIFVLMVGTAPFFPGLGFFLPIVSHGSRRRPEVALSFDDGPDPALTPRVLDLLERRGLRAVFFLVGAKAERHPDLVREILAKGHDVGNHSWSHLPFLMLTSLKVLRREVERTQAFLETLGVRPRAFRPPVGITNSRLWPVLLDNGMFCLNFSCRAADLGNRRVEGLAGRILGKVRPGDLILLHDVAPARTSPQAFLAELERLLDGLEAKGLRIVPPAELLERPLLARRLGRPGPAQAFYDTLAETYDREQFETGVSRSQTLERRLFLAKAEALTRDAGRVLEIGAGTGIFTLELARRCREVDAVDVSREMLDRLERKAQEAGLTNIRVLEGDAERMAFQGPYSAVFSFMALEYVADLPALFRRLAPHLEPGARIYVLTARSSFLRFWIQIGNALRQGLWLRGRSRRGMKAALEAAGATPLRIEGHLLKGFLSGGMLLEVEGRWPDAIHD